MLRRSNAFAPPFFYLKMNLYRSRQSKYLIWGNNMLRLLGACALAIAPLVAAQA